MTVELPPDHTPTGASTGAGNAAKQVEVQVMFDRISGRYDLMNLLISAFQEPRWRRRLVRAAGLQPGDVVLQVDGKRILDAAQLRELISNSGVSKLPEPQQWLVQRKGEHLLLGVTPRQQHEEGRAFGRVGAMIGGAPAMVQVRYGFWSGIHKAGSKTWEVSALTLRMMGQIVTGAASVRNLSGPITIADYAGRSAAMGLEQFMVFLALISISLGVLNLLPLPVLDGGHLMYYGWEGITGRPVSEAWLSGLQRVGFAMLLLMMSIAIFNDFSRLFA